MKRERRIFPGAEIRVKKGSAKPTIEGYAAVFDKRSVNLGWFVEVLRRGAFTECLGGSPDVRGLFNHDPNNLLSRTMNNSLKLAEDSRGLQYEMEMADTQAARDVYSLVDRGDVTGCSFSFTIAEGGQNWNDSADDRGHYVLLREVTKVGDLYDVGPVTFPAYPDTSVDARSLVSSLWPQGIPEDVRAHMTADFLSRLDGVEKRTKKVDGFELTANRFAFVGDENNTSTWKIPLDFPDVEKSKSHVRNAPSRFAHAKGIPEEQRSKVWKKIIDAARRLEIKFSEEDKQRAIQAGLRQLESCDCTCDECQAGDCENCNAEDRCEFSEREAAVTAEERERMKMRLELSLR